MVKLHTFSLVKEMPRGIPELRKTWQVNIIEGGKEYTLILKLYKSRLNIEDKEGNKIAVDKRDGCIKIEKWGDVDWHREGRHG